MLVPVVALAVVGGLALLLRWTFGRGGSLVARSGRPGSEREYGLLVPVAAPRTMADGDELQQLLERAGVRANLATTSDGLRLMVFAQDEARAIAVLGASTQD